MEMNDDVMNMAKGWVVCYEDGTILTEYDRDGNERPWTSIPKVGIKSFSLKWYNKHWSFYGKEPYFQNKRGWIVPVPGLEQAPNIEERCIGYWEGNNKVTYRVNELTGQMRMEVETIGKEG